jgi:hypothetical protein
MFSFVRISENSMVASVRIARWLQKTLGDMTMSDIPLVCGAEIGDMTNLDVLIIVNGAYGFSKVLEPLSRAILGAKRVVWVQNDYTIIPPKDDAGAESPFRKAFVTRKKEGKERTIFWSTCEKWYTLPGSHYVNWNMLTFDQQYSESKIKKRRADAKDTLLYYGSFRDGSGKSSRVPLFDRYFTRPAVETVISSPVDKFAKKYPLCRHMGAIGENFYGALGSFGLGLYIEDRKSSEEFHSPANRFYEMLSAGLPMVFQPESGSMLRKAGFNPDPYVVSKAIDVKRFMANREDIGREQRREWNRGDFYIRLVDQLDKARLAAGL